MSVRQTYNESWYRVADLRPRLRSTIQTFRQHYRGQTWHVIADPSNQEYFRLDESAYYFIGLLDGKRRIAQAWAMAQQRLGDAAPTQGEAIHLLGRLFVSNLLHGDVPPDVQSMFERQRKRRRKEVGGQFANLLFMRIPLYDPDRFLEKWMPLFGWVFGKIGMTLWCILLIFAGLTVADRASELAASAGDVLSPANLIWMSVCFWGLKLIHEFGHAFACKKFGIQNGTTGEVHTMGVMLLALMPVPFVDASAAWTYRSKWHRMFIGAAGMYVELAVAAVAALIWARTGQSSLVHQLSYNVMFIASVSTIVFNGNPLLRYDAYYILCDWMETPNLQQRSKAFVQYLVKRVVFGLKKAQDPTHGDSERRFFVPFAIAAFIYRIFVTISIILFVADQLFILGVVMATTAAFTWTILPVVRLLNYLVNNQEIGRVRSRAVLTSLLFFGGLLGITGFVPLPDRARAEGVVEPRDARIVHMGADGFVQTVVESGQSVTAADQLITAENPDLVRQGEEIEAQQRIVDARHRDARQNSPALVRSFNKQRSVVERQITRIAERVEQLNVKAPIEGTWVAPDSQAVEGRFLRQGEAIGMIATLDDLVVRVTADQSLGPRIEPEIGVGGKVEFRVRGRPDLNFTGTIERILPAGQRHLPSQALSAFAGGTMQIDHQDDSGTKSAEAFFEIHVQPDGDAVQAARLFAGQRVIARFEMPSRPLAVQGYRALRRMLQQRFQI